VLSQERYHYAFYISIICSIIDDRPVKARGIYLERDIAPVPIADGHDVRPSLPRYVADDLECARAFIIRNAHHARRALFDYSSLLEGNGIEGVAQVVHMVLGHGDDSTHYRALHRIRGIQSPAHADLYHGIIHFLIGKELEAQSCGHLEERGVVHPGIGPLHLVQHRPHSLEDGADLVLRYRSLVNDEPLLEIHKMRRGVEPDIEPRASQDAVCHGRGRPFSVRTGNVDNAVSRFGASHPVQQIFDVVQAQFDAELLEIIDVVDGVLIIHWPITEVLGPVQLFSG
jgi:hypothetical protein